MATNLQIRGPGGWLTNQAVNWLSDTQGQYGIGALTASRCCQGSQKRNQADKKAS